MKGLARRKKNFRVITIDIGKWGSPVAAQYEIRRLPSLWLYEGKKLRTEDRDEIIAFLRRS